MYRFVKVFTVVSLVVVSTFAFAVFQSSHVASAQTDTKALAQAWVDAQNAALKSGDATAVLALYSPDYTDESVGTGAAALDAVKQNLAVLSKAFPDAKPEVQEILVSGDEAAVYTLINGTNTGPIGPYPATGKAFSKVKSVDILTFKDGKVTKDVSVTDTSILFQQIGWTIAPPPAPAATAAQ